MKVKHELHDIWKEYEGKKPVWKVQAQFGIITFKSNKVAEAWVAATKKAEAYIQSFETKDKEVNQ